MSLYFGNSISRSKNYIWFFFTVSVFFNEKSIHHSIIPAISRGFTLTFWIIFVIAALKSLSNNSSIYIISLLTFADCFFPMQVKILLVLQNILSKFWFYPGHFELCYETLGLIWTYGEFWSMCFTIQMTWLDWDQVLNSLLYFHVYSMFKALCCCLGQSHNLHHPVVVLGLGYIDPRVQLSKPIGCWLGSDLYLYSSWD